MKKYLLLFVSAILMANLLVAQVTPTVVASGFSNLIGVNFDIDGNLWVGEMGSGNDDGQITIIDLLGNKTVFMTGLPSNTSAETGETSGPYRALQMPDNKVLILSGEGPHAQAEALLVVDKTSFTPGTPFTLANVEQTISIGEFMHPQGFVNCNPFNVTWDADGQMYIADSGGNSLLKRDKNTGELSIIATLPDFANPLPFGPPMVNPVTTKILPKPDGSFYVCQLTGFPFISGMANVYNLAADGTSSVHQGGFTCLTDMNFDPSDGNLCVGQFGTFGPVDTTFGFQLGTAMVIKLMPDGSHDTLTTGIGGLSSSFTFAPNGNLYVTDLVFGQVLKYSFNTPVQDLPISNTSVHVSPNPCTEKATITYSLSRAVGIDAGIYDLQGRCVARFALGTQAIGQHQIDWTPDVSLPNGVYVWRLLADKALESGTVVLSR